MRLQPYDVANVTSSVCTLALHLCVDLVPGTPRSSLFSPSGAWSGVTSTLELESESASTYTSRSRSGTLRPYEMDLPWNGVESRLQPVQAVCFCIVP